MEIKKFRKKYKLELIPASHEGIVLGTCVWDAAIGKPKFSHKGMPEHILNAFVDADILTREEWRAKHDEAKNHPLKEASFAERTIEWDAKGGADVEHPTIGKLGGNFDLKKVSKFSFGDLKVRAMSSEYKMDLDDMVEKLKDKKWKDYDGKIKRVFMITELYYGSVSVSIDTAVKAEFDAAVKNTGLKLAPKVDVSRSGDYTFDNDNVPFAMKLERVKQFNG